MIGIDDRFILSDEEFSKVDDMLKSDIAFYLDEYIRGLKQGDLWDFDFNCYMTFTAFRISKEDDLRKLYEGNKDMFWEAMREVGIDDLDDEKAYFNMCWNVFNVVFDRPNDELIGEC